jgi:hypothetical protein
MPALKKMSDNNILEEWAEFFESRSGRLTLNNFQFSKVKLRPNVPARDSGDITAIFEFVFQDGAFPFPGELSFEFDSTIDYVDSNRALHHHLLERIRISSGYANTVPTRFQADGTACALVPASVRTLEMCKVFESELEQKKLSQISLVLTPNHVIQSLSPAHFGFHFSSDERKGKKGTVSFPPIGQITFDIHYDWSGNEGARYMHARYCLVAKFRRNIAVLESASKIEALLPELDDFFLLCGFSSRIPTRCTGWIVNRGRSNADYFRRTHWLPVSKSRQPKRGHGGLVPTKSLPKFLTRASHAFKKHPCRHEIRLALRALDNSGEETIEQAFLSLFSALEGLVNVLSKDLVSKQLGEHKDERDLVRKKLMATLSQISDDHVASEASVSLYRKAIQAVESASFRNKVLVLNSFGSLACADLWPIVVGPDRLITLYKIRNSLAHGRAFETRQVESVMIARHHLVCTLERLLCELFNWPLSETDVAIGQLAEHWIPSRVNWKVAEKIMRRNRVSSVI